MALELLAYRVAGAAGLLLAAFALGWHFSNERQAAARVKAIEQAREVEEKWQTNTEALQEVKDAEIARIARERDDALRRLRDRPGRMPEASAPSCQGATGAQLSGPDAGFLVGLAAEGARIAAELAECRAWIDEVKGRDRESQ